MALVALNKEVYIVNQSSLWVLWWLKIHGGNYGYLKSLVRSLGPWRQAAACILTNGGRVVARVILTIDEPTRACMGCECDSGPA